MSFTLPSVPTSAQIRKQYIDFFVQKHGHTFVPSSPVVPHDDPTLLFTNAGMNQFKPIFLGQEKLGGRGYTRAVNTQKCIRAGGKHNDLDDVGRSRRHHTFFEMLGNWSFGDYFKQGAIEMSWELLTKVWKMDPRLLHVTCFEGDEKNGVPRDTEAADIWKKVANWEQYGLKSEDHIHFCGAKDNFWEMGETGPCGPCTEINVDRRPGEEIEESRKRGERAPVNGDDPRVMEIWNNVFIQYNRNADRSLTVLPAQHVDTGMGFERVTQVLQGVGSNYEIDLFDPFWKKLEGLSGHKYTGKYPPTNAADPVAEAADAGLRHDIAFRVIADHIRCLTFAITDGGTPSNEGRGYVLRRILRRAVRFGRQQLGLKEPFLHTLVPVVGEAMGEAFPELRKNPQHVIDLVKDEEVSFGRTLDRGLLLSDSAIATAVGWAFADLKGAPTFELGRTSRLTGSELPQGEFLLTLPTGLPRTVSKARAELIAAGRSPGRVSATDAFQLHDTYGFPIDLTRIMAEEMGLTVDVEGYERLMEKAREKARAGGKGEVSPVTTLPPSAIDQLLKAGIKSTLDTAKYAGNEIEATVIALWDGQNLLTTAGNSTDGADIAVITDQTNFYSEMGGQVGDTGRLSALASDTSKFRGVIIDSTKAIGGYVLHIGHAVIWPAVGDKVLMFVNHNRRAIEKNHTTTHLANWALREVFGDSIQQKGSLVDPEKLRFDFSHNKGLTDEELARVETMVSSAITSNLPVYAEEAPQEQAMKINGLRAVFGEKYPPLVRVVSVGAPVKELLADPANPKWRQFSIEFCGGTHLATTAEAGAFVITEESSVSKGIRRIVGLTGEAATLAGKLAAAVDKATAAGDLAALQTAIAAPGLPLGAKRRGQAAVVELQSKTKQAEKAAKASGTAVNPAVEADRLLAGATPIGPSGKLVVGEIPNAANEHLLAAMDSLRQRTGSYAIMLATSSEGKVTLLAAVSDDLIAAGLKSGDWIRPVAGLVGGSGGGRPNMAQAGGKDPSKLAEALGHALEIAPGFVKI